jgi:rod shape-determining protein MreC
MSRRPYYVAFGVVLLIAMTALNLPERQGTRLKLAWGSVFVPLFGLAGSVETTASQARQSLVPETQTARRLQSLQQTNQALRLLLAQTESIRQENQRLRRELLWRNQAPWRLRLARVIGQDPANWWRSLWINLGSRESVQVDMPVLTPSGLVGRVTEVGYTRSRVVLVGDPNCRFSALVVETRDKGIIMPDEASFDRQIVRFTYVPSTVTLRPGGSVSTSGDGGVFPKGIPVGQLVDVATNSYGLYLEARVRLNANLNRLEEVWVLFP